MRSSNPAALAWALVLGHEARVSGDDEREVRAMITTRYMTSFTPEEMALLIEQGKAKDARIAELEAQLAAAQERERENVRLLAECNRILDAEFPYSTRSLRAEIAAALAAAQPASDGGKGEA